MSENKNLWLKIIVYDFVVLVFLLMAICGFNYVLKNQIADSFRNELRNDFLMFNQREVNRKILSFLDYSGFLEVKIDKTILRKRIKPFFNTSFLNVIIKHELIGESSNKWKNSSKLEFKFSLLSSVVYSFSIWVLINFFLILLTPKIKRYLEIKIQKQHEELRIKENIDLAMQVSHDIRSPVAVLNVIAENLKDDLDRYSTLQGAIVRIDEIANRLLASNRESYVEATQYSSVMEMVNQIIIEKTTEYKKLGLEIFLLKDLNAKVYVVPKDFKIILSNIINNSVEACTHAKIKVNISVVNNGNKAEIFISDNGTGIPSTIIQALGKKSITTKPLGNGLGLKHAYNTLKDWGGSLEIVHSDSNGTTFKISLIKEIDFEISKKVILIDDDELIRTTWRIKAERAGFEFQSFENLNNFKSVIEKIDKDTVIYIDSEIGLENGEEFAKKLNELGFTNISITSGHPADKFKSYNFLRSIISKKPPF